MATEPDHLPNRKKPILTTTIAGLGALVGTAVAYTVLPRILLIERGMPGLPFVALAFLSGLLVLLGWRIWARSSANLSEHIALVSVGMSIVGSALCGFGITALILTISTLTLTGFSV